MFNNPFDSFHKTVSSAKEEREQLDRLLTISTPTERFVVAAIGVCLIALLAWLWFGDIPRNVAFDSVLLQFQDGESEDGRSVQALVWVDVADEEVLNSGISVVLDLASDDGEREALNGEVTSIVEVPVGAKIDDVDLTEGLKDFGSVAPFGFGLFHIGIRLGESGDLASILGRECRILVEVDGQSPLALFGLRRS